MGNRLLTADLTANYEHYCTHHRGGWGLAWYLATAIGERFYCSHGIAPSVLVHEGLGHYGMGIGYCGCLVKKQESLGRFTMGGNVENWRTGGPGDHGLKLEERAAAGELTSILIAEAVRHLDLPSFPEGSHLHCRHKRWGASFQLVFRIAAVIALRMEGTVQIWSATSADNDYSMADQKAGMSDHPGYLVLEKSDTRVVLCGDGRILPKGQPSLWDRYMTGESLEDLVEWTEHSLQ